METEWRAGFEVAPPGEACRACGDVEADVIDPSTGKPVCAVCAGYFDRDPGHDEAWIYDELVGRVRL